VAWERRALEIEPMQRAAAALVGEHDFTSFRAPGCQARHALRTLHSLRVTRRDDEVRLDVRANAFLYHMVRIIAGTLIEVGAGRRGVDWPGDVLAARRRSAAGPTAPPEGLYFAAVDYPDFPDIPVGAAPAFPRGWNLS
jgi:tRNA pseudouridine38-40 synthase